jgi:hypothetical protein
MCSRHTNPDPIIDYAKPRPPSRYPAREWLVPLTLFLLPFLILAVLISWALWNR